MGITLSTPTMATDTEKTLRFLNMVSTHRNTDDPNDKVIVILKYIAARLWLKVHLLPYYQ